MADSATSWKSDIVRHSAVYMFAAGCSRLVSFVLLPVYLRHLSPADYGVLAILDLFTQLLAILFVTAVAQAASRYHFRSDDPQAQASIWWTALAAMVATSVPICALGVVAADTISLWLLGSSVQDRSVLFTLALFTVCCDCVHQLLLSLLRVQKRSIVYMTVCLSRLLLAVVLNVWFVVYLKMEVRGVFLGLLIANAAVASILLFDFVIKLGSPRIQLSLVRDFAIFGGPLLVTGLLAVLIHQSDRFLLRVFAEMNDVGVYSLAHKVSYGINSLLLLPFTSIWNVVAYEVAVRPDANDIYVAVYRRFMTALLLVLFAIALVAQPLVALIDQQSYRFAAELVPLLCVACFCYGSAVFFTLPARLENKTTRLLPASVLAAFVSIGGNCLAIPLFGALGAAWVSAITCFVFACTNYVLCQRVRPIPYSVRETFGALVLAILGYVAYESMFEAFEKSWIVSVTWLTLLGVFSLIVLRTHIRIYWHQVTSKWSLR